MIWLAGAGCLIFGIALCAIVVVRGKMMERLVALELTSVLTAVALLLAAGAAAIGGALLLALR